VAPSKYRSRHKGVSNMQAQNFDQPDREFDHHRRAVQRHFCRRPASLAHLRILPVVVFWSWNFVQNSHGQRLYSGRQIVGSYRSC
jgi:hypothetical protein